jgi:signal transduction histidine kinase
MCARLKSAKATKDIPVIFLSAVRDAQDKVRAFQVGGADYITKPFNIEEVEARVRAQLDIINTRRSLDEQNQALEFALRERDALNRNLFEVNERLRRSEAIKGRFLAAMRNEVNNPLSVILALGAELERGVIPAARQRDTGATIAGEASALDFQVRNVFWAAELEAGAASPTITRVDVPSVLRAALDSLRYQARRKDIALNLEASGAGVSEFGTDAEALRTITANLVSNAITFGPAGRPVRIQAQAEDSALVLKVEDQGSGIRPESLDRIFERFGSLEPGPVRMHHGPGLGLSVVRALVDLLDGRLTVASEPERGSSFTCTLPRRAPEDSGGTWSLGGNLFFFGESEEA